MADDVEKTTEQSGAWFFFESSFRFLSIAAPVISIHPTEKRYATGGAGLRAAVLVAIRAPDAFHGDAADALPTQRADVLRPSANVLYTAGGAANFPAGGRGAAVEQSFTWKSGFAGDHA